MNKKSGFVVVYILIALVVLGIVAGGVYYFGKSSIRSTHQTPYFPMVSPDNGTPAKDKPPVTSTPISSDGIISWKTYTNTKYNYSFKYPDLFSPLPSFFKANALNERNAAFTAKDGRIKKDLQTNPGKSISTPG